jgi:hypothetical protein
MRNFGGMFEAKAWKFSDARCPMPDYKISYSVLSATIRVRQASYEALFPSGGGFFSSLLSYYFPEAGVRGRRRAPRVFWLMRTFGCGAVVRPHAKRVCLGAASYPSVLDQMTHPHLAEQKGRPRSGAIYGPG